MGLQQLVSVTTNNVSLKGAVFILFLWVIIAVGSGYPILSHYDDICFNVNNA